MKWVITIFAGIGLKDFHIVVNHLTGRPIEFLQTILTNRDGAFADQRQSTYSNSAYIILNPLTTGWESIDPLIDTVHVREDSFHEWGQGRGRSFKDFLSGRCFQHRWKRDGFDGLHIDITGLAQRWCDKHIGINGLKDSFFKYLSQLERRFNTNRPRLWFHIDRTRNRWSMEIDWNREFRECRHSFLELEIVYFRSPVAALLWSDWRFSVVLVEPRIHLIDINCHRRELPTFSSSHCRERLSHSSISWSVNCWSSPSLIGNEFSAEKKKKGFSCRRLESFCGLVAFLKDQDVTLSSCHGDTCHSYDVCFCFLTVCKYWMAYCSYAEAAQRAYCS